MPKDVVIVIDRSGSMLTQDSSGATRLETAKSAALVVLGTLSPRDRVGVVVFSDEATAPTSLSGCFSRQLAQATPSNIARISAAIRAVQSLGGTMYEPPLNQAFDMLLATPERASGSSTKLILFLSDGEAYDDALPLLRRRNSRGDVRVFTYGIGEASTTVLAAIATQNGGRMFSITSLDKLRDVMGSYYQVHQQQLFY
jgi:Mg-chelatase subunit ChlD